MRFISLLTWFPVDIVVPWSLGFCVVRATVCFCSEIAPDGQAAVSFLAESARSRQQYMCGAVYEATLESQALVMVINLFVISTGSIRQLPPLDIVCCW